MLLFFTSQLNTIYYFIIFSLFFSIFIFSLSSTHIHLWHHHRKCKTSSSTSTTWSIPHDLPHSNAKKNQKTSRNQKNNKSVPKNPLAILCIQKRKRRYCKADESFSKPTTSPPTRRHKRLTGKKENSDGSNMALLGLHEWVYKETSCAPRLTLIKTIPTRKGSLKIRVLMRIFPTRKDPLCQEMDVNTTLL